MRLQISKINLMVCPVGDGNRLSSLLTACLYIKINLIVYPIGDGNALKLSLFVTFIAY